MRREKTSKRKCSFCTTVNFSKNILLRVGSFKRINDDEVTTDDVKDAVNEREERAKAAEQARIEAEAARLEAEAAGINNPVEGGEEQAE